MSAAGQNTQLIFVYGSLKIGFGSHALLERYNADFMHEGMTLNAAFSMKSLGRFPGVFRNGDEAIWGEVYKVTDKGLDACDRLEGHPHFYRRHEVDIVTDQGHVVTAWMYLLPNNQPAQHNSYGRIKVEEIDGIKIASWIDPD